MGWRNTGSDPIRGVLMPDAQPVPDLAAPGVTRRADIHTALDGNAADDGDARRDAVTDIHAAPIGDGHGYAAPDANHAHAHAAPDLSASGDARVSINAVMHVWLERTLFDGQHTAEYLPAAVAAHELLYGAQNGVTVARAVVRWGNVLDEWTRSA